MKEMDFWTAFAEYLGKNEKISTKNGNSSSSLKESKGRKQNDHHFNSRQSADYFSSLNGGPRIDEERSPGFYEYASDNSTLLSLQPWIFRREGEGSIIGEDQYPRLTHINPRNISPVSSSGKSKSSLRSRKARRISIRNWNRSKNSLIPPLYAGKFDLEDSTGTPVSSPPSSPRKRSLITDGNRLTAKSRSANLNLRIGNPNWRCEVADRMKSPKSSESIGRVRLFSFGVCVGAASSLLSSKREIDRLNELLKQRENMVQDLREEQVATDLTQKNSELDLEEKINLSPKLSSHSSSPKKEEIEGKESRTEIEAELEAELEKLELCMNASDADEILSPLSDEGEADIVQGELKIEIGGGGDSDGDHPGVPVTPPPNYAVSPRQLSIRLHELIQSQLQERIKELEAALRQNRQKVRDGGKGDWSLDISWPLSESQPLETKDETCEEFQKPVAASVEQSAAATPPVAEDSLACSEEESVWSLELGDGLAVQGEDEYEDDDDDEDDEDERMLIQQVVERARKGSPVVQNAQKMLSMGVLDCPWDENL